MTRAYSTNDPRILNDPFFREFNMLFKNALQSESDYRPFSSQLKMPYPINVSYVEGEHVIFEIPIIRGKVEDIEVTQINNVLRVKYTRSDRDKTSEAGRVYVTRGIVERDFDLSWKLPSKIDHDGITSKYKDGLLTITLPYHSVEAVPVPVKIVTE
jgi:HSP20 family molecular chaperone IbpA